MSHTRKPPITKPKLNPCFCGQPGIKKYTSSWICQTCLDRNKATHRRVYIEPTAKSRRPDWAKYHDAYVCGISV